MLAMLALALIGLGGAAGMFAVDALVRRWEGERSLLAEWRSERSEVAL